jgi:hypothetical protein
MYVELTASFENAGALDPIGSKGIKKHPFNVMQSYIPE